MMYVILQRSLPSLEALPRRKKRKRRISKRELKEDAERNDKVLPEDLPEESGTYGRDEMGRVVGVRGVRGFSNMSLP